MKVWITRDDGSDIIDIRGSEPRVHFFTVDKNNAIKYYVKDCIFKITKRNFKRLFGFIPRKGTCRECELKSTEIK